MLGILDNWFGLVELCMSSADGIRLGIISAYDRSGLLDSERVKNSQGIPGSGGEDVLGVAQCGGQSSYNRRLGGPACRAYLQAHPCLQPFQQHSTRTVSLVLTVSSAQGPFQRCLPVSKVACILWMPQLLDSLDRRFP